MRSLVVSSLVFSFAACDGAPIVAADYPHKGREQDPYGHVLQNCEDEEGDGYRPRDDEEMAALRGCKVLAGALHVGRSVTSLESLGELEEVDAVLIQNNRELTDLRGLESLHRLGSLYLSKNAALESLEGLGDLEGLGGLVVSDNEHLVSVEALAGVDNRALRSDAHPIVDWSDNPRVEDLRPLAAMLERGPAPDLSVSSTLDLDLRDLVTREDYSSLALHGEGLRHFDALQGVGRADKVSLSDNYLTDLSALGSVEVMERLSISRMHYLEGLEGLSPELELDQLRIYHCVTLADASGLEAKLTRYLSLSNLPALTTVGDMKIESSGHATAPSLIVSYSPLLEALPRIEGTQRAMTIDVQDTSIDSLDPLANIIEVEDRAIVWANPYLMQKYADLWAQPLEPVRKRVGDNAEWHEPEYCPWQGDGYCDEGRFCERDDDDCYVDTGGC
jgi:hypothetical protein